MNKNVNGYASVGMYYLRYENDWCDNDQRNSNYPLAVKFLLFRLHIDTIHFK